MPEFRDNAIFWVEVGKIKPNPYQPRIEFNDDRLQDLADSIRQYGVLQPLVVTRKEVFHEEGGMMVEYELIAGERRLRASKIAGIEQVPVLIKSGEETDKIKLELAIIENLQREDLNPVDRAQAFHKLANEFNLTHKEIGKKVGKSREYVSNTIRLTGLPQEVLDALMAGQINEGHTRPILMLTDRPEEQMTFFKEIMYKRMTVREAESIARRIAFERARKKTAVDPEIIEMEEKLTEKFGTRVKIDRKDLGGKVTIDFFSVDDLQKILRLLETEKAGNIDPIAAQAAIEETVLSDDGIGSLDAPAEPESSSDDDLYFVKNFSV